MGGKWLVLTISVYFNVIKASEEWEIFPNREDDYAYEISGIFNFQEIREKGKYPILKISPLNDRMVVIATAMHNADKHVHMSAYPPSLYGPHGVFPLQNHQHKALYEWWEKMKKSYVQAGKMNVIVPLSGEVKNEREQARQWGNSFQDILDEKFFVEVDYYRKSDCKDSESEVDSISLEITPIEFTVYGHQGESQQWCDKVSLNNFRY